MFKQLDHKHVLDFECNTELLYRFGEDTASGWVGISYYSVPKLISAKILRLIPVSIRRYMFTSAMVINRPEIPAHVDNEIKVSINFYVETAGATTYYHKIKNRSEASTIKLPNQTNGIIFLPEFLDTTGEFMAETGDVWVLDVTQPHSVSCKSHGLRTAYCAQSQIIEYSDVLHAFAGTGLISEQKDKK